MITAKEIFDAYLDSICRGGAQACVEYRDKKAWTHRATLALIAAGKVAFPEIAAAAKANPDRYEQPEYLTLSVLLREPESNIKPPLFIAEYQSIPIAAQIQFSVWKLLVVEAQRRVLVAHYGDKYRIPGFNRLKELVKEVCSENMGKDILLIGGRFDAEPQSEGELRRVHETAIVGVHHKENE